MITFICWKLWHQNRVASIEVERARTAVTYSLITATQERCRLAASTDGTGTLTDVQLMGQARKGTECIALNAYQCQLEMG